MNQKVRLAGPGNASTEEQHSDACDARRARSARSSAALSPLALRSPSRSSPPASRHPRQAFDAPTGSCKKARPRRRRRSTTVVKHIPSVNGSSLKTELGGLRPPRRRASSFASTTTNGSQRPSGLPARPIRAGHESWTLIDADPRGLRLYDAPRVEARLTVRPGRRESRR